MKINYRTRKITIKEGDTIFEEELNSGKLFIFDMDSMEEYKDEEDPGDWEGDRIITHITILGDQQYGYISGTTSLFIHLPSLQKYRDENQI